MKSLGLLIAALSSFVFLSAPAPASDSGRVVEVCEREEMLHKLMTDSKSKAGDVSQVQTIRKRDGVSFIEDVRSSGYDLVAIARLGASCSKVVE